MNHKYLHAINGWTKELDWLSWENFFSHEKQCFVLQSIFNFISSIANLKSQCLLGLTLSCPQGSRRLGRKGRLGSFLSQKSTRKKPQEAGLSVTLPMPRSPPGIRSLLRPHPEWRLEPACSDPGKAKPNQEPALSPKLILMTPPFPPMDKSSTEGSC